MITEGVILESRFTGKWKELEEQRSKGYSQKIFRKTATVDFSLRHKSGWRQQNTWPCPGTTTPGCTTSESELVERSAKPAYVTVNIS